MKIQIQAFNQIGHRLGWAEVEPTESVNFNIDEYYYHNDAWEYVVTFAEGTEMESVERFYGPARERAVVKFTYSLE